MGNRIKSKNFIIPLVVYPFDVMVSFAETDDELFRKLDKYKITDSKDDAWKFETNGVGRCILFEGGQTLIRLNKVPLSCESYGELQHEIFHAVQFLMKRFQMKLSMKNCEAYAYLIQYLTQEIYKKI